MFRRLLREPLVHFLVLGGLLFAASGFVGGGGAGVSDKRIVVTAADIGRLSQQFLRTWNCPPSAEELQTQIEEYVREEVLYRTALALGLDKDDLVIRRRLRQKMDFLMEGAIPEPQDNQLLAYFHAHEGRFLLEPTISFRQILVSDNRGTAAEHYAQQLLTKLIAAKSADLEVGDPSLLAREPRCGTVEPGERPVRDGFRAIVEPRDARAVVRPLALRLRISPCFRHGFRIRPTCLASPTSARRLSASGSPRLALPPWTPNIASC